MGGRGELYVGLGVGLDVSRGTRQAAQAGRMREDQGRMEARSVWPV